MTLPPIVRLMRPHQYAKNMLVFSAPGAAGRLDETAVVGRTLAAFALFCAVSSAGYVVNDLLDAEADRQHPTKRDRPLANRSVSPATAMTLTAALGAGSLLVSPLLGWTFTIVLFAYAALSASYSMYVKRVIWVELIAVSSGFLLRAVAGGAATDTRISGWFLLVVSTGALLVITGKRLGELLTLGSGTASRSVLSGYSTARLRATCAITASVAVGGYAAWAASEAKDQATGSSGSTILQLTTIPFALAIGRYLALSWQGRGEAPESLVARDALIIGSGVAWMALYAIGKYS